MKNKKNLSLIVIFALILTGITTTAYYTANSSFQAQSSVIAIKDAGKYLQDQIQPSGQFVYRVSMDKDRKIKRKYNILRHMGSVYSLNMLEEYLPGSVDQTKLKNSISYIIDNTFRPLKPGIMGIWSSESFSGRKGMTEQTKLGAAGLSLVALSPLVDKFPDILNRELLKEVGNLVLHMQKEDGSFFSKYYKDKGFDMFWVSLYYPGEAAFGLVELYKVTKDKKYLDGAFKAMLYLEESRRALKISSIPADHWALIATDKLIRFGNPSKEVKERLTSHAQRVVELMISQQIDNKAKKKLLGGFSTKGNTTPTATRVEGLVAILPHITDSRLLERTKRSINLAVGFIHRTQIKKEAYNGAWSRSIYKYKLTKVKELFKRSKKYKEWKKHNARINEIRIDYVQHALSALIEFEKLRKEEVL